MLKTPFRIVADHILNYCVFFFVLFCFVVVAVSIK